MEERRRRTGGAAVETAAIVLLLLFLLTCARSVSATKYTVGRDQGWNPGVNYTIWAQKYHFYIGDWLVFDYQAGQADVMQVNATAYNNCLSDAPIVNYSKGRSFAFELNETKRYYFICSKGYCYNGMKLSVLSEPLPPPSPPPSSQPSDAVSLLDSGRRIGLLLRAVSMFAAAAACGVLQFG